MVKVFFLCSSPFVGYTLRQADYIENQMLPVTEQSMTPLGYKIFNSSGSYMVLADISGYRYFHTRQSQSEQYDEQGRRIYANIAFLGSGPADRDVINKLAAYAFFEEDAFYKEIAAMITLSNDGFTIDFEKLSSFLKRFEKNCTLDTASTEAKAFCREITNRAVEEEVTFVLLEATWNYFIKQVGYDFHNSVKRQLSSTNADNFRIGAVIQFSDLSVESQKDEAVSPPEVEKHGEPTTSAADSLDKCESEKAVDAKQPHNGFQQEQQDMFSHSEEDMHTACSGAKLLILGIIAGGVLTLIIDLLLHMIGVL